ncbi:MAG: hypothetical protein JSR60_04435 [Proteobacteria bacterium]|nr:hypothetical protein [Pseudomonadota bacterium]
MRLRLSLLSGLAILATCGSAFAEPIDLRTLPSQQTGLAPRAEEQPWQPERPLPALVQQPIGDVIAARLGLVEGSAELFRFRVENAPSSKTVLDGVIDGGGIKLKLTW